MTGRYTFNRLINTFAAMFYPKSPFLGKPLLENEILKVNAAALPQLLQWLCETPRITTYRVNTLRTSTAAYKAKLEARLKTLFGDSAPEVYSLKDLPEILCIAPIGVTNAASVDSSLKELMVDCACGAALLRGAHIFAPGVLAMESGTQVGERVAVFADLSGKCKRGTATRFESNQKIYLGEGEVLMQRYKLYNNKEEKASGIAVRMESNISGVPALGDLSDEEALLQNLPSIICVRVLAPQPGERILDMCAAPGNKTSHIAELMGDKGSVLAFDNSASRVKAMLPRLKGYKSIKAQHFDSTQALAKELEKERTEEEPPFAASSFDRVLLDAPCSGLGNRPQLVSSIKQLSVLQSYPHLQRRLFEVAVQLLRPGGVLVYSTCTISEAECEEIVAWALRKFPELRLADATPRFGGAGLPHLGLSEEQCRLVQRFGPSEANSVKDLDTVGFFIAKFVKQ